jgi:glycosyltransferase involved in cell wall biosynthesis
MKLLLISRAYPPVIGGLEKHNHALHEALLSKTCVEAIINRKGKKALLWFLPLATLKSLFRTHEFDVVLLGDGLLSALGWAIKLFRPNTPIICIIHGLDITYPHPVYQFFWIRLFLPKMDQIIAVSQATAETAIKNGLNASKVAVIPNGVHQLEQQPPRDRKKLDALLNISTENKIILFTIGRLVKRKGVNWFIQQVMPKIQGHCIYLVAGDGQEKAAIDNSIQEHRLEKVVHCIGFVTDELKSFLFANADLFIQPNIKVDGDMEGFGIAVLEANAYGLAVLGSNLEGLKDSITENQNGWLLEPGNATGYTKKITELAKHPIKMQQAGDNAKRFCLQHFSWDRIAEQYLEAAGKLTK